MDPKDGAADPAEGGSQPANPPESSPADNTKGDTSTLHQMPDGRMLTGEQVLDEYKSLQSDYTKKSQILAELTRRSSQDTTPGVDDRWKNPEYRPQTWEEVLAEAERRSLVRIETRTQEAEQARLKEEQDRAAVNTQIDAAVTKIKETDKTLNEDDMFVFAAEKAKKGVQYTSVEALYDDYKMIREARKQGQQQAMRNITNRAGQDVGVGGAAPPVGNVPIDILSLRGNPSIVDAVKERARRDGLT